MLKGIVLGSVLSLCLALPARAAGGLQLTPQVAQPSNPAFAADVVEVQTKRSAGTIVVVDVIGGAIAGAAIGGGVAVYNRYVSSDKSWGDWQRDLALGAGIGAVVGLVFGIVDASSNAADRVYTGPVADRKQTGFAPDMASYGRRF